ncbi:MAK10-like protein [Tanacetum coccineum]|uniref:MAK10-like protein n=1 Tax=Tanacetum coccineum TaxID=301880 RepID=A0ABQ5EZA7_9ASTR
MMLQQQYMNGDINRLKNGEGSSRFSRLGKMEFLKFYGDYVKGWMFRIKQFFAIDVVMDEDKIKIVSIHMFGDANEDLMVELKNFRYKTNMKQYHSDFEALLNQVNITEAQSIGNYFGFDQGEDVKETTSGFLETASEVADPKKIRRGDDIATYKRHRRFSRSLSFSLFPLFCKSFSLTTMENGNPIRTLVYYSRPSHEGYQNTIELPDENNVMPLQSDTIRLVQYGCSFHGLRSEDPNQHLKDFLKLVDSLDLDVANRERTHLIWALLEDLALYDNESWNDPRDFAKPVKAISLPQDVLNTSDRRLIELENQVQRFMEAHLPPNSSVQVNKIASSCEICSGPHDTQYCMENSSKLLLTMHPRVPTKWEASGLLSNPSKTIMVTPIIRYGKFTQTLGLVSNFMAYQDARLSKFGAYFKQQQSEMTNKIDTILKAINDRVIGALPSDTVKNSKLNVNPTSSISFARSYPMEDPQSSFCPLNSINAVKMCSKESNSFQKDQLQTVFEIGTPKPKEPEHVLKNEFKDLHRNLLVLKVVAHAPMYNAILDKYVESLELGKNGPAFIQGEMPKRIKDPRLFTLPYRLRNFKPFDTLANLGSCVNLIPLHLFKKLKIGLLEETNHVFGLADGTKSYPVGIVKNVEVHIGKLNFLKDFYVIDMEKDLATPLLIRRGFLATASAVIDCKKAKIVVRERVTRSIFGVKEIDLGARPTYYAKKDFMDYHFPGDWEIARDAELNPFKDVLVFRKMVEFLGTIPISLKGNMWESKELVDKRIDWNRPPKGGDRAWHIRIELIDPDGERFTRTFQSIPTTRKLFEK